MENIGQDFTAQTFAVAPSFPSPKTLLGGVVRASRVGFTAIWKHLGSLKEAWDAAELRAAMIERRVDDMKREQQALYFGRHRIF